MIAADSTLDSAATEQALRLLNNVADARATLNERVAVSAGIGAALERTKQAELTALAFPLGYRDRLIIMSEK